MKRLPFQLSGMRIRPCAPLIAKVSTVLKVSAAAGRRPASVSRSRAARVRATTGISSRLGRSGAAETTGRTRLPSRKIRSRPASPRVLHEGAMPETLRARREQVVREHMESENRHEFDVTLRTFAHPRYELIATGEVYDGEEAVRGYYAASRAAFPDQRNAVHAIHHADDAIIVEFDLMGKIGRASCRERV